MTIRGLRRRAAASEEPLFVPEPFLASVIEQASPEVIRPHERTIKVHNEQQIVQLMSLIASVGFLVPIIVDEKGVIIAGHARYMAAVRLGLKKIPVIRAVHLTAAQVKAFRLADNKIAERSDWDPEELALELKELLEIELEEPGVIDLTCFETGEIDAAIEAAEEGDSDPADEPMELGSGPAVTRPGDLIRLGRHWLYCGSSLEDQSYAMLLGPVRARTVASDPPYNVKVSSISGLGRTQHREFAMASGEMSDPAFIAFLARYLALTKAYSLPGALHYAFMDSAHLFELLTAAREADLSFKTICTWGKTNAGMGGLYRQQTEHCLVTKNGGDDVPHVNNIQLGKWGRYRTTLWTYPGCNTFRKGRMDDLESHPTCKNRAMIADLIKDSTHPGEAVLDAFCGSGTTILAAEGTGRVGYGIELDPLYCDLTIRRFEKLTGRRAVYEATGMTFDEARTTRQAEATLPTRPLLLEDKRTDAGAPADAA